MHREASFKQLARELERQGQRFVDLAAARRSFNAGWQLAAMRQKRQKAK